MVPAKLLTKMSSAFRAAFSMKVSGDSSSGYIRILLPLRLPFRTTSSGFALMMMNSKSPLWAWYRPLSPYRFLEEPEGVAK